jgi:predicted peptidase
MKIPNESQNCTKVKQFTRREFFLWTVALPISFERQGRSEPRLASGTPYSPERLKLIEAFENKTTGLAHRFEARTLKAADGWEIPYRLFRPEASGRLPLVLYLHGSGGSGNDNHKQIESSNIFGVFLWAMPETQAKHPCYIVVPQTDRRWLRYEWVSPDHIPRRSVPGFGEGSAAAVEIIKALRSEFAIDERRIYVTGNSMGGGGVWHMVAHCADLFAAAVPCCGGPTLESASGNPGMPVWNFHGDADTSVPVDISRERIEARRKAGGKPLYTEYEGVGHDVSRWAYTEPALPTWLFAKRL